jgi:hypothetical protein
MQWANGAAGGVSRALTLGVRKARHDSPTTYASMHKSCLAGRRVLGKSEPLAEFGGHSHWVWKAQYNPAHDQLLASASSDCQVALWYTPQLARSTAAGVAGKPAATAPVVGYGPVCNSVSTTSQYPLVVKSDSTPLATACAPRHQASTSALL